MLFAVVYLNVLINVEASAGSVTFSNKSYSTDSVYLNVTSWDSLSGRATIQFALPLWEWNGYKTVTCTGAYMSVGLDNPVFSLSASNGYSFTNYRIEKATLYVDKQSVPLNLQGNTLGYFDLSDRLVVNSNGTSVSDAVILELDVFSIFGY